jgi:hypothetical protein
MFDSSPKIGSPGNLPYIQTFKNIRKNSFKLVASKKLDVNGVPLGHFDALLLVKFHTFKIFYIKQDLLKRGRNNNRLVFGNVPGKTRIAF